MDARITKAEAALLLPAITVASRRQAEIEALRLHAIAARDAAIGAGFRRAGQAVLNAAESLVRALATFPAPRADLPGAAQLVGSRTARHRHDALRHPARLRPGLRAARGQ
jgi:hypothetical protein